jgi:hypothetical protein
VYEIDGYHIPRVAYSGAGLQAANLKDQKRVLHDVCAWAMF